MRSPSTHLAVAAAAPPLLGRGRACGRHLPSVACLLRSACFFPRSCGGWCSLCKAGIRQTFSCGGRHFVDNGFTWERQLQHASRLLAMDCDVIVQLAAPGTGSFGLSC